MKKVIVVALVLCLLMPVISYAQVDLVSMTDEELIRLGTEIEAELLNRSKGESFDVPPGKYVVGLDFPAGTYKVTVSNSAVTGMIVVYPDKGTMDAGGLYSVMELLSGMMGSPTIGKLEVKDGNGVWVSSGMLTFEVYTGIGF